MVKKLIFITFLLCQASSYSVPLGVDFGLGFSRSNRPSDTATGLLGGLCTDLPLAPWIGFAPEANLLVPSGNVTYLSLPLLIRLTVELSRTFALDALIGPDFGIRLTGATFKESNFWLVTGVAVSAKANDSLRLRLSLRHGLGLTDFTIASGDDRLHTLQLAMSAYFEI
ncbi:MAG: hypothetical protein H6617_04325 [Bdellovibrionaceae bacterium]|nr:hypothetical protein [Pseudobdellovibrionaceae bacterium]